jgi:protease I
MKRRSDPNRRRPLVQIEPLDTEQPYTSRDELQPSQLDRDARSVAPGEFVARALRCQKQFMNAKPLRGVTVAVLVADGFEQVEVMHPIRTLKRAGAKIRVLSLRPGRLRGVNFIWRGRKLAVDELVAHADPEQYAALLLPGGFVSPDLLRQSEPALEFVKAIDRLGRPIAVICHGPEVLISAGLVRGRHLTSWPGITDDVRNAGGIWKDDEVVRDDNWVSSRGPQDLFAFERAMVDLFAELAPRQLAVPGRPVRWVASLTRPTSVLGLGLALVGSIAVIRAALAENR